MWNQWQFCQGFTLIANRIRTKNKVNKSPWNDWKFHYLGWFVGIIGQNVTCPKYADCNQAKAKRPKKVQSLAFIMQVIFVPKSSHTSQPLSLLLQNLLLLCFHSTCSAQYIKFRAYKHIYKSLMDRDEPFS